MGQVVYRDKDGEMYHEGCLTVGERADMTKLDSVVDSNEECEECGNLFSVDSDVIIEDDDDDTEDDEEEDD